MFFKRISIYDQKIKNAYFGKGMVCVPSDAAPYTKSHTYLIAMFPIALSYLKVIISNSCYLQKDC